MLKKYIPCLRQKSFTTRDPLICTQLLYTQSVKWTDILVGLGGARASGAATPSNCLSLKILSASEELYYARPPHLYTAFV